LTAEHAEHAEVTRGFCVFRGSSGKKLFHFGPDHFRQLIAVPHPATILSVSQNFPWRAEAEGEGG
jgi:hypothetical protein